MYSFTVDSNVNSFQLDEDTSYLCIVNIASVPPHISFICNGFYFSYSVYGLKLGTNAQSRLDVFTKRKIPTVLVSLGALFTFQQVKEIYENYDELKIQESCLNPIIQLLNEEGLQTNNQPFYLFDLLSWLINNNKIQKIISLNSESLIKNSSISLQKYTQKEIDAQINKIKILKK